MKRPILLVAIAMAIPVPAPGKTMFSPGDDPALDKAMSAHTRLFYQFHALPFGIGLDMTQADMKAVDSIHEWLVKAPEEDPGKYMGVHPFTLLKSYDGYPGIGLRGGGAVPGTAFRYMALKAEGASAEALEAARKDVVKAVEALHVVYTITGVPGRMARGIQRITWDEPGFPTVPGPVPETTPLFDDKGNPLPPEKNNGTDRPDNSGGLLPKGMWIWQDSCSKDQLVGWVIAMVTLYDAANGDAAIDQALVQRMRDEAGAVGAMLREKQPFQAIDGETYEYDLVIMDADGRPTFHNDLNPLSFDRNYFPPDSGMVNIFNLVMGLGIVKGLYHVSGDPEAEAFLYGELLGKQGYLGKIPLPGEAGGVDYIYMGVKTNFSDVNMIAIALFLNIWTETDPVVAGRMRQFMESRWWDVAEVVQTARRLKQPYFHALYLAMTDRGTDPGLGTEAAALLKSFKLDPYLDVERINCDDNELGAKQCLAIDGKSALKIQAETNRGGKPVATEALDPSIRPASNFDARSDPFEVNGGGGPRLVPGGDLHAAYWLLRFLPEMTKGTAMMSANARVHMPVGGWPEGGEETSGDIADGETMDAWGEESDLAVSDVGGGGGNGCVVDGWGCGAWGSWVLALMACWVLAAIRRTARLARGPSPATTSARPGRLQAHLSAPASTTGSSLCDCNNPGRRARKPRVRTPDDQGSLRK